VSGLYPAVRNVRELKRGVQADVIVGEDPVSGVVTVQVTSTSPTTLALLERLKASLKVDAHHALRSAQRDQERRGQEVLGR
jgi:hypothetical protein